MRKLLPFLLAPALLALGGCSPALDDPPQVDAARASRRADGTGPPRRDVNAAPVLGASRDPAATMGAAPALPRDAVPAASAASRPAAAPAARVDDGLVTARVRAELAAARDLGGARIDVDTRDGIVTLSGAVGTAAVKARASEIARGVRGVQEVNDQLTLVTS